MIKYYLREFLQWLGYRKVWYLPEKYSLSIPNFCKYEYRPYLNKGVYNEDYELIKENIHE